MASSPDLHVGTRTVAIKVLRCVWETGWSGAVPERPWPDREFTDIFQSANGRSVRDFWLRSSFGHIDLRFDIEPWAVLQGASHETLKDDGAAIVAACRRQAAFDHVPLASYPHVIAFVHEPPADVGTFDGGLVLDQNVRDPVRHRREVGRLIGFGPAVGADGRSGDPYCFMGGGDCRVAAATLVRGAAAFRASPRVVHAVLPGTLTLTALGAATGTGPVAAVVAVVPPTGRGDDMEVIVEYRTATGDDGGVAPAVVVHSAGGGTGPGTGGGTGTGTGPETGGWAVRLEATLDPRPGAQMTCRGVRMTVLAATHTGVTLELSAVSAPAATTSRV
jgi:hypothetical protein